MAGNPLGKETGYPNAFDPGLLVALPRSTNRKQLGLSEQLPFVGEDVWHAYEISWLNKQGLPRVAVGRFYFPCTSPSIIESKSFKLFLNSLNQEKYNDRQYLINLLTEHLSKCSGDTVKVELLELGASEEKINSPQGVCLDALDVSIKYYQPEESLLTIDENNLTQEYL